ncbi:hypothetical protein BT67DRAFT_343996, partial [Trichocladium antarcticum]
EPPPSPWQNKYGGCRGLVKGGPDRSMTHSGLAPSFPGLDTKFFAHDTAYFARVPPLPRPSDEELDTLFAAERTQIAKNAGLTTAEVVLLTEHLAGGLPGGHRPTDQVPPDYLDHGLGYGVTVDETSWHSIFSRGKWFDYNCPVLNTQYFPRGIAGITPTDIWSVDNP